MGNEQQRVDVVEALASWCNEKNTGRAEYDRRCSVCAAVAELIEADREYDEAEAGLSRNADGPLTKRIARLNAAVKRRSIALANVGAQS